MLETLYFYALAHQNDFDVSWCKWVLNQCSIAWILKGSGFFYLKQTYPPTSKNNSNVALLPPTFILCTRGSIAEKIFSPLMQRIESNGGQILGNRCGAAQGGGQVWTGAVSRYGHVN